LQNFNDNIIIKNKVVNCVSIKCFRCEFSFMNFFSVISKFPVMIKFLLLKFLNFFQYFRVLLIDIKISNKILFLWRSSVRELKDNYRHVGKFHLEINSNYGIFLDNCHRFVDIYPLVYVIEDSKESSAVTEVRLDGTMCEPLFLENKLIENITGDSKYDLQIKFDSVAINFKLEEFDLEQVKLIIEKISQLMKIDGIFFGSLILGSDYKNHSKKALKRIKDKNNANKWKNINFNEKNIEEIFLKFFSDFNYYTSGSIMVFRAENRENEKKRIKEVIKKELKNAKFDTFLEI